MNRWNRCLLSAFHTQPRGTLICILPVDHLEEFANIGRILQQSAYFQRCRLGSLKLDIDSEALTVTLLSTSEYGDRLAKNHPCVLWENVIPPAVPAKRFDNNMTALVASKDAVEFRDYVLFQFGINCVQQCMVLCSNVSLIEVTTPSGNASLIRFLTSGLAPVPSSLASGKPVSLCTSLFCTRKCVFKELLEGITYLSRATSKFSVDLTVFYFSSFFGPSQMLFHRVFICEHRTRLVFLSFAV